MSKKAKFKEEVHQAVVMRMLDEAERQGYAITSAGDQNAAKRGAQASAIAKLTGLKRGEPDVRCILERGLMAFFELKTEVGRLDPDQITRHDRYRELGHFVFVIKNENPLDSALDVAVEICALMDWSIHEWAGFATKAEGEIMQALGVTK